MEKQKIADLLKDYKKQDVEKYASYIIKLKLEKKKDGLLKNPWIQSRKEEQMAELFERVLADGLVFDGVNVTLQSTGVSYNYIAYKNKMLLAYPESKIDVQLVYKEDFFETSKSSGVVNYRHEIVKPFERTEADIIGGYCVIINKRGEFMTLLSKDEIDKHRKVAKTDYIWSQWFVEMALKTLIKKACKLHFSDIFQSIEEKDNNNYDIENPLDLEIEIKSKVDEAQSVEELTKIYKELKGKTKNVPAFNAYITIKKGELK